MQATAGQSIGSGLQPFHPQSIPGITDGLFMYYDPGRGFWSREIQDQPVNIYRIWSAPEYARSVRIDGLNMLYNNAHLNGTENINFRATDLTILAAVKGENDAFKINDRIRLKLRNGGEPEFSVYSSVVGGYCTYRFSTDAPYVEDGINVVAYTIPKVFTQASDMWMAQNGIVIPGRETYKAGDPYGQTGEDTTSKRIELNSGGASWIGHIKIWDRALSPEELQFETANVLKGNPYLTGFRSALQANTVPSVELTYPTTFDVGGEIEVTKGTSWDLGSLGNLEVNNATTWDVFYDLICSRGSYWDVPRFTVRPIFEHPHDGDIQAKVLNPYVVRLDRYEKVVPDGATKRWKWSAGIDSIFNITKL
jgi:hypothetical protein